MGGKPGQHGLSDWKGLYGGKIEVAYIGEDVGQSCHAGDKQQTQEKKKKKKKKQERLQTFKYARLLSAAYEK